ncbi:hypothetical protein MTO96_030484 [Rhipicephalus appendiculatus]
MNLSALLLFTLLTVALSMSTTIQEGSDTPLQRVRRNAWLKLETSCKHYCSCIRQGGAFCSYGSGRCKCPPK